MPGPDARTPAMTNARNASDPTDRTTPAAGLKDLALSPLVQ
jgi:hypothetical protein